MEIDEKKTYQHIITKEYVIIKAIVAIYYKEAKGREPWIHYESLFRKDGKKDSHSRPQHCFLQMFQPL